MRPWGPQLTPQYQYVRYSRTILDNIGSFRRKHGDLGVLGFGIDFRCASEQTNVVALEPGRAHVNLIRLEHSYSWHVFMRIRAGIT